MKKYKELSLEEKKILKKQWILNGFWPQIKPEYKWYVKLWLRFLRWILSKISWYFNEADADYHDHWYYFGWDENRRFKCDSMFFFYMCRDIERYTWFFLKSKLYFLAFIYYYSVRFFGKYYFNYTKDAQSNRSNKGE